MIKVCWQEVKESVAKISPTFYELVENITPKCAFPLFLAKYHYGELIGSKSDFFVPNAHGSLVKLDSGELPNEVSQSLQYGKSSAPLSMILNNYCEWFQSDENSSYPHAIQGAGTIFNQQIIFQEERSLENNTISLHAGARSIFMLSNIGAQVQHNKIISTLKIHEQTPKSYDEHYTVFRSILRATKADTTWQCTILFFSEDWVKEIQHNPNWLPIKMFFSENLRKKYTNDIWGAFYNDFFMTSQSVNRFRPTPYLIDTARHIFSIMLSKGIGYVPATNNELLPIDNIADVYSEIYGLPYAPKVMVPGVLSKQNTSVYYSLQQPSKKINTFKIRMNNSAYRELVALKNIISSYVREMQSEQSVCFGTILQKACTNTQLNFYHNKFASGEDIIHSGLISTHDRRFCDQTGSGHLFAEDARFFRGCLGVSYK